MRGKKKKKEQQTKTTALKRKKKKQLRKCSKDSTLLFPKQYHETKHK